MEEAGAGGVGTLAAALLAAAEASPAAEVGPAASATAGGAPGGGVGMLVAANRGVAVPLACPGKGDIVPPTLPGASAILPPRTVTEPGRCNLAEGNGELRAEVVTTTAVPGEVARTRPGDACVAWVRVVLTDCRGEKCRRSALRRGDQCVTCCTVAGRAALVTIGGDVGEAWNGGIVGVDVETARCGVTM